METLASLLFTIVATGLIVFALLFIICAAATLYIVWRALTKYL